IEVEAADDLAFIEDVPGLNRRIPGRRAILLLEGYVKDCGCSAENALLHRLIGEVWADALRVEVELGAPDGFAKKSSFIVGDFGGVRIGLVLFGKLHLELALSDRIGGFFHLLDEV